MKFGDLLAVLICAMAIGAIAGLIATMIGIL